MNNMLENSDNVIYDFLGINLEVAADLSNEIKEKERIRAKNILTLQEQKEWEEVVAMIDEMLVGVDRPCELYAKHPKQAFVDSGYKYALNKLKSLFLEQSIIAEKYAKEKENSGAS